MKFDSCQQCRIAENLEIGPKGYSTFLSVSLSVTLCWICDLLDSRLTTVLFSGDKPCLRTSS